MSYLPWVLAPNRQTQQARHGQIRSGLAAATPRSSAAFGDTVKHRLLGMLLFLAAATPSLCQAQEDVAPPDELEEITLTHINWGFPAYFTQAPRNLVRRMEETIDEECERLALEAKEEYIIPPGADARDYVDVPGGAYWLCERRAMHFYRGIDGWGKETNSGFVCDQELGLPGQKYIGDSRFEYYGCVFLWWDDEARRYEIEFGDEEE